MTLIRKMANRYKNIDTTEEEEQQMPKPNPKPQCTRTKQIHHQKLPKIRHDVKFYLVQKDHETGRRLSKQILW